MWKDLINNDKALVIIAFMIIACFAIWKIPTDAKEIVIPIISGLSGIVTGIGIGVGMSKNKPTEPKSFIDVINESKKGE